MQNEITGKVYVLGDNVDTDQIIPAQYLTYNPAIPEEFRKFGCGSSREHAPIALKAAGIVAVVAEFYARIFYRNSVNGGYLIPIESEGRLCDSVCTGDELRID